MDIITCAILLFVATSAFGQELMVTKDYTDYLKKHVTWEVVDYEENIFRGWTVEECASLLGDDRTATVSDAEIQPLDFDPATLPKEIDWSKNANCFHEIRTQGTCGSCWTFSSAGVVSDRCCLHGHDHGWLAPQELVSCEKECHGCNGGSRATAMKYIQQHGLVPEACYPYLGKDASCPAKCVNGGSWASSHVCKCTRIVVCNGVEAMKKCLTSGPIAAGMDWHRDMHYYKGGVYHWDKKSDFVGAHAIRMVGYGDQPERHWKCANSFGASWGMQGFFLIALGELGIDSREPQYCDPIS